MPTATFDPGAAAEGVGLAANVLAWVVVVVGCLVSGWFVWVIAYFNSIRPCVGTRPAAGVTGLALVAGVHAALWAIFMK